jgi:hypothetical protein
MKDEFSPQVLEKCSNNKFHKNPSSGSRVISWRGRIDTTTLTVASLDFANTPRNWQKYNYDWKFIYKYFIK